jgi:hypothetical protein
MPAASVLPANSNAGLVMLTPQNLEVAKKYVLSLKDIGCQGVQLDIQYPVYDPAYFQFARDRGMIPLDSPDDRDFRRFYRELVQEIRGLGLKVLIENQVTFTQKTWSPPAAQLYEHLNGEGKAGFEAYKRGRLEMAGLIPADLQPDFLTVSNEPDTEMDIDFFNIHLYPVDIFTKDEKDNIIPRTLRTSDLAPRGRERRGHGRDLAL